MRRAKIVSTLGPSTSTPERIRELVSAGMDVARLNLSHGEHAVHEANYRSVREASDDVGRAVGVLVDLQGPKIRTGRFADGPIVLAAGDHFTITTRDVPGDQQVVGTTYPGLAGDVRAGDTILVDDGKITLAVHDVDETDVRCVVVYGGPLSDNKGINRRGGGLTAPALTAKDKADIKLAADMDLVDVSHPTTKAFRRRHAPIATAALLAVVLLAALDVAPIMGLAFLAAAVVLITGCVDPDEAFGFVEARLLAMIFAMLAIGEALDSTGAVKLIVDQISPLLAGHSPFWTLVTVYFLGLILTELLSNNAVAVILTPIAIQLAIQLGHDPRPFVVAVMFSASVAFATPIGYQTHMMVYGPGGYRFSDFMRVGIPLDIVTGVVACLAIPLFWPL